MVSAKTGQVNIEINSTIGGFAAFVPPWLKLVLGLFDMGMPPVTWPIRRSCCRSYHVVWTYCRQCVVSGLLHIATGEFEGAVNGQEGTFDFFLVAQLIDLYYTGQLAIEPGSGTGDLTGINGIIKFNEEPGDEPPWPVTGYYYYDVMSGAPMLQEP